MPSLQCMAHLEVPRDQDRHRRPGPSQSPDPTSQLLLLTSTAFSRTTVFKLSRPLSRLQWLSEVWPAGRPYVTLLFAACSQRRPTADLIWWQQHLRPLLVGLPPAASCICFWITHIFLLFYELRCSPKYLHHDLLAPFGSSRSSSAASGDQALGFGAVLGSTVLTGHWIATRHSSSSIRDLIYIYRQCCDQRCCHRNRVPMCSGMVWPPPVSPLPILVEVGLVFAVASNALTVPPRRNGRQLAAGAATAGRDVRATRTGGPDHIVFTKDPCMRLKGLVNCSIPHAGAS